VKEAAFRKESSITSIAAWCMYDFASSAFSTIITTFIFATYFTTRIAENEVIGTHQWANAIALSGLIIALCSPLFGSIADHSGYHKRWLLFFTIMCIVSCALLWFAFPSPAWVNYTLVCVVFGTVGLEVGTVFYNAYLPYIVPRNYLGRISGWGWGSGYLGGILALLVVLLFFVKSNTLDLDLGTAAQIRISGPFVAVWIALFSLPLFLILKDIPSKGRRLPEAVSLGWRELIRVLKSLPSEKNVFIYLISHMIYADGLNTLFAFGGIYAAGTYGLSFEEVLIFGITMNITAGLGALLLSWVDDYMGSKPTVVFSLVSITLLGIPILFLHDKYAFWALALVLCIFIGPIQSASRSLMVRLIAKKEMSTEMFGLYALSGKITAFMGPWILGWVTLLFGSQRVGMATVLVFFAVGMLLLLPVKVEK